MGKLRTGLAMVGWSGLVLITPQATLGENPDGEKEDPALSKVRWHHLHLERVSSKRVVLDPRIVMLCDVPRHADVPKGPHEKGAVLVYANSAALEYRRDHLEAWDYPVGSTFLKDKYASTEAQDPHLATKMTRVGDAGSIGDWEFSVIDLKAGKEEKLAGEKAAACADCHSNFAARGFVSEHTEWSLKNFLKDWKGSQVVIADRPNADSKGFLLIAAEAEKLREKRLLSAVDFARLASRPDTLVLDARSQKAFAREHVSGAVNLPYTEFNPDALAEVIPSQDTAVLIYCSNNINYPKPALKPAAKTKDGKKVFIGGGFKGREAALTIPTFITLYGYGYRNLYELGPSVVPGESVIEFEAGK